MFSNPNLVYYACIAQRTTILAEFSREADLKVLAQKCIEKTPHLHSMFSHTVRNRTYTFFIDRPFVYFAIFDQSLDPSEAHLFLNHHLRCAFEEVFKGESLRSSDNFSSYSFQPKLDPFFRKIMESVRSFVASPPILSNCNRNLSTDSKGSEMFSKPLLGGSPSEGLKKRLSGEGNGDVDRDLTLENKVDVSDDVNVVYSKDFSLPLQKNHSLHVGDRQKEKQVWRKHVWVVLLLDLFVCSVLFVIWLWVCRGFKCIDN